ncbi:MAG: divergent polysaccharide deacetylase family protein [Sulfuricurvum sp.]|nr:divergent polysaccharide deacetylase family protein [Sulfuricurvum sp.]
MSKQPHKFQKISILKWIGWGIFGILFLSAVFSIGYFFGFNQADDKLAAERIQTQKLVLQIEQIAALDDNTLPSTKSKDRIQEDEIRHLKKELEDLLEREHVHSEVNPHHEYAPNEKKAPPAENRPVRTTGSEAKLVIIIDDVSYAHDVKEIKSTGLPLVMSFLPPSSRHPDSGLLAKQENTYMIHLPLEAVAFHDEEPNTLHTDSSEEEIAKRLEVLKQIFPKMHYVNNHTGSKFTSDTNSMDKLIRVMKKDGLQFVDSRTIGTTKGREITAKYGMRYLGRDVFLDDEDGIQNIKGQIRDAVEEAKRHGFAIAIGHPRVNTIKALKESKEVLKEVQLVGIDQL